MHGPNVALSLNAPGPLDRIIVDSKNDTRRRWPKRLVWVISGGEFNAKLICYSEESRIPSLQPIRVSRSTGAAVFQMLANQVPWKLRGETDDKKNYFCQPVLNACAATATKNQAKFLEALV